PTHFGVVMIVNLLIGLCTPPVGILLYLSAAAVGTRPEGVIREAVPMVIILIAVLMLITYVPAIVLTFPNMFYD
ncbi:MAG: TRAP transporter large permease subunit, partial [Rhodospirillales bacterium]